MKKALFFISLSAAILSCSKNNKELSDLTQEVVAQKSIASMKQSYGFLSAAEKSSLWQTKLNAVLDNDNQKLTNRQREIVAEIKGMLEKYSMEDLIANSQIGENFLNQHLSEYAQHFTTKQLYLLIENPYYVKNFSIFNADAYLAVLKSGDEYQLGVAAPSVSDCSCYYNISCGLIGGYCDWKAGCIQVAECGLFGTSNCKGKCD